MQEFFAFSGLVNFVISLFLGVLVLVKNRKEKINILCSLLAFSTSLWSLFYWRWLSVTDDASRALFLVRWLSVFSTFIPLFYFHWVIELVKEKRGKLIKFYYGLTVFYGLFFFSDFFVARVAPIGGFGFWPRPGLVYNMYFISHYMILVSYGLWLLFRKYRKAKGLEELQYRYVLIGSVLGLGGAFTNFFQWYDIGIPPFGNWLVPFYVLSFTYAIIRYRLLGIGFIFNKIYYYAVISVFAFAFFQLTYFFINHRFEDNYSIGAFGSSFGFSLMFSLFLMPLVEYVRKLGNRIFFHGHGVQELFKNFTVRLSGTIDIQAIFDAISEEFGNNMNVKNIRMVVLSEDNNNVILRGFEKESDFNFKSEVAKVDRLVVYDEVKRGGGKLIEEMRFGKIKIILPLFVREKKIGLVLLGDKISGEAYVQEDVGFLETVGSQLAIAIENARLYKEIEDFNSNLKSKVEDQIGEIKRKNDHLKKLLKMRSEFLNISSHQLRTPISVIKGMLSMLVNDSLSDDKKKEFARSCLQKAVKLEEIINDILCASEMDSGKFELNLRPVKISSIINELKKDLEDIVEEKGLDFIVKGEKRVLSSKVMSDDLYLRYALKNVINNAIQYTSSGRVVVDLKREDGKIIIDVSDTGIGIPDSDIERIFRKFTRAGNATDIYTDGSGLGLFIAKEIIKAHHDGRIYVKSTKLGKGTIISIELPQVD